ncbi:uncharacterized protein LOC107804724 isoform X1 [Nicotiana tabacum]|uniref:Uncharacterized protein LOC107804724 isoform X1 n=1 Tax=Nicotiana tabacum TaxID=4097 RepID=A0AC58TM64_TOBAC
MLRVSTIWPKYSLMKRTIPVAKNAKSSLSLVQTLNNSLFWLRKMSHEAEPKTLNMPGQHEKLPSDFPTTTTPPNITTPTDAPPAVEDSPFVPDFDAIPPIRQVYEQDTRGGLRSLSAGSAEPTNFYSNSILELKFRTQVKTLQRRRRRQLHHELTVQNFLNRRTLRRLAMKHHGHRHHRLDSRKRFHHTLRMSDLRNLPNLESKLGGCLAKPIS